jgi:hypothetical protein
MRVLVLVTGLFAVDVNNFHSAIAIAPVVDATLVTIMRYRLYAVVLAVHLKYWGLL